MVGDHQIEKQFITNSQEKNINWYWSNLHSLLIINSYPFKYGRSYCNKVSLSSSNNIGGTETFSMLFFLALNALLVGVSMVSMKGHLFDPWILNMYSYKV